MVNESGGGLAIYANKQYCCVNNVSIKTMVCTTDIELACFNLSPYYLAREFKKSMSSIFCAILIKSWQIHKIPTFWKTSEIIPLPQKKRSMLLATNVLLQKIYINWWLMEKWLWNICWKKWKHVSTLSLHKNCHEVRKIHTIHAD